MSKVELLTALSALQLRQGQAEAAKASALQATSSLRFSIAFAVQADIINSVVRDLEPRLDYRL